MIKAHCFIAYFFIASSRSYIFKDIEISSLEAKVKRIEL